MEEYNFSSNGIKSKATFFNALEYPTITLSNTKNKFFLKNSTTNVALNKIHFSLHFYSLTLVPAKHLKRFENAGPEYHSSL